MAVTDNQEPKGNGPSLLDHALPLPVFLMYKGVSSYKMKKVVSRIEPVKKKRKQKGNVLDITNNEQP